MALIAPPPPPVTTLACRGCGAPLTVRAPGRSLAVICPACGAVLDPRDPDFRRIAQYEQRTTLAPRIPLGARGRLKGEVYEVIGYLVREITVEGERYAWGEYLLVHPSLGLRWLTEYNGHWILAKTASGMATRGEATATYLGRSFRHFQTAVAAVRYVIGEFPWVVRLGDRATVSDYIDPPHILSCEETEQEITWSVGEHLEGAYLWKTFNLPGAPPAPIGVGAVQPSPFAPQARSVLLLLGALVSAALAIHLLFAALSQQRVVYQNGFTWDGTSQNAAVVTAPFALTGRRSNVVIDLWATVSNSWVYFNLALIDAETGAARTFGREVSYYFGRDSDGAWSEGSNHDRVYLASVASGTYYLLIEPESTGQPTTYAIQVRRDVPRAAYLAVALAILAVPPLVVWYRRRSFEYRRWLESDHPRRPLARVGADDDDDD